MNLTEEDSSYYNNIFNILDSQKLGIIDSKKAALFLKKSNLSQNILKNIWSISSQTKKSGLSRDEFFISLRLIALAQNNFPFTRKEIENNNPLPPLPTFSSFNNINHDNKNSNNKKEKEEEEYEDESVYEIPEYNINLYKKYFEMNKDSKDNYISTKKANEMWKRNSTSLFTLQKVANSLKPLEKKGFLNLKEFQVANHLLSICNCHEIPNPLPNCLLNFLGRPLNENQTKKRKIKSYKNFNDYMNQNFTSNNNNQLEDNFDNNQKISESNEFDSQKVNPEEIETIGNINENNIKINQNENNVHNKFFNSNDENGFDKDKINNNENTHSNDSENLYNKNENLVDKIENEDEKKKNNTINNVLISRNNKNLKKTFKSSIKENKNDNEEKSKNINNDNTLLFIMKRLDELETKNKNNNSKISFLISKVNTLQKEQIKINKEMIELKKEIEIIKGQKRPKNKNNNSLFISLNNVFSEEIKKENNNIILNENQNDDKSKQIINNNQRIQKKLIIKREDKNDGRKSFQINNENILLNYNQKQNKNEDKNYNNLKRKELNIKKKIPMDGKDEINKFPKNGNDNDNIDF